MIVKFIFFVVNLKCALEMYYYDEEQEKESWCSSGLFVVFTVIGFCVYLLYFFDYIGPIVWIAYVVVFIVSSIVVDTCSKQRVRYPEW